MRFTQYRGDLRMRALAGARLWHGDDQWSDAHDIVERIRRYGRLDCEDLVPDDSGDSWPAFERDAPALAHGTVGGPPASAVLQEQWERDQRARRLVKQAEADKIWDDEETKRAKEKAKAEAREKRQRTIEERQRRVEEVRRLQEEYHRQVRAEWIALLEEEVAEVRGTRYAVMLPDIERDIATIRDHPPGPLPWKLDKAAFQQAKLQRMREIDDGTQNGT